MDIPYAVSTAEAMYYYAGISRSPPKLVFRTSKTPWVKPTGPEAYRHLKQLREVYGHKLNDHWDNTIGPEVLDLLDQQQVRFSSVDVVRFRSGKDTDIVISPVVLWIGVLPGSLLAEEAFSSANGLLELLKGHGIHDVDVEYRESVYRSLTGPKLYEPASNLNPIKSVIDPLTTSLGLPIANAKTPHAEGTLSFYFAEGGESEDILAATARHVLFPSDDANNSYTRTNPSMPRRDVLLMGTKAWDNYLQSVQIQITSLGITAEIHNDEIKRLETKVVGTDDPAKKATYEEELEVTRGLLAKTRTEVGVLEELYKTTKEEWETPNQRIIGHIVHSPPITFSTPPHPFTMDLAIIQLEKEKFSNCDGNMNVLGLGTEIEPALFTRMMYPHHNTQAGFKYPGNRLLQLKGIIPENLLRHPDTLDSNGDPCLLVIKRGLATQTTIGRATGIFSYVREYLSNKTCRTSKEWAILPYDSDSDAFSKRGDSGSVIVDGRGRFGGLLTGGTGLTESIDVTYATPFFWLWSIIKVMYPHAHLDPIIE